MSAWSKEQDLTLLSVEDENKSATSREMAAIMTARGYPVTADAVQKRLLRLHEQIAMTENESAQPVDPFADIPSPEDSFVGIRIGFWDLETTDLKALMGRILISSIADSWGNVTTRTIYDFDQTSIIDDRGVCAWTRDELNKYDMIVTWNGKMFDAPFLNARLLRWGEKPWLGAIHQDPMWTAKAGSYGLRIGSAKLDNVDRYFDRSDQLRKTAIDWDIWAKAMAGDREAMGYLVEHCENDTLVLRKVWNFMKPMFRGYHR